MKLPYHQFSNDYQPDAMHTIRRVASCVIHWLSQQMQTLSLEKLSASERAVRKEPMDEGVVYVLTNEQKKIANGRIQKLVFTPDCTGCIGDVFTNSGKVLKNHHGWQEVPL